MKSTIVGTLCGLLVSVTICCSTLLFWQHTDTEKQLNFQQYIYMRAKSTRLQIRIDYLQKLNDNLILDIEILRKQAPTPTPAPTRIAPC